MNSANDLWLSAGCDIMDSALRRLSRDGPCREVIAWQGVMDPDLNFITVPERKLSASFAAAEILWYLSGERDTMLVTAYAPQYERFTEPNGEAHGAYGHRWLTFGNQLATVISLLNTKPDTRQAIITAWDPMWDLPHACAGDKKDIPCTLSWQFLIVAGKLELIVTMRSEDLWLGFPYDVFSNTILQRLVADAIGLPTGRYIHNVGSLHIYERDFKKFSPILQGYDVGAYRGRPPAHSWKGVTACARLAFPAISLEIEARRERKLSRTWWEQVDALPEMLRDLVLCCAGKWHPFMDQYIKSVALKGAQK